MYILFNNFQHFHYYIIPIHITRETLFKIIYTCINDRQNSKTKQFFFKKPKRPKITRSKTTSPHTTPDTKTITPILPRTTSSTHFPKDKRRKATHLSRWPSWGLGDKKPSLDPRKNRLQVINNVSNYRRTSVYALRLCTPSAQKADAGHRYFAVSVSKSRNRPRVFDRRKMAVVKNGSRWCSRCRRARKSGEICMRLSVISVGGEARGKSGFRRGCL